MTSARVLVVADEYYASLAAVRALRAGGYEPWVAATTAGCLAAGSRAVAGHVSVPRPSAGEEEFVAAVAGAVARWGIDVVLPGTEPSLLALAGRRLGPAAVGAPPRPVVARATAKETLAETGLRTPGGTRFAAPAAAPPAVDLPAVVKPARSTVEGDGATVDLPRAVHVERADELERVVAALPPGEYLAQPYVSGGLGAIAGVAWHGELVCVSQQAAERIEPPFAGASAYARSVPVDPILLAAAERFLGAVGWSGLWEIQFLGAPDDPVAIDFNPRFYGSLALAVASGLNLPSIWVDLLLGREPRIAPYRPGRRYRAEARDAKLMLRALRGRRLAEAAAIAVPRRGTTHAVFSWRDPAPALHLIRRAVRR